MTEHLTDVQKEMILLKRKKNKDEKGEEKETFDQRRGGEWIEDYKGALDVEMWVWNCLKVTRGGDWFPSLIFWMDQTRVWQKKNRTKNNELVALKII